jgi:large repetitive protein
MTAFTRWRNSPLSGSAETAGFSVTVTNACDPMLQGYDESSGTYTTEQVPGKVNAYRFMTFYLQPDPDNGDALRDDVVDQNWLKFSSDPNAIVHDTVEYMQAGYATGVLPQRDPADQAGIVPHPREEAACHDRPVLRAWSASHRFTE